MTLARTSRFVADVVSRFHAMYAETVLGALDPGAAAAEVVADVSPGDDPGVVYDRVWAACEQALADDSGDSVPGEPRDQLLGAIRAVADGGSVMDPKVVEALVAENARAEGSPLNELTPRERDVLREMAEGKNNAAIAEALFLTQRSVEKVIHSIFLKLGLTWETAVHKRVKAVILYLAESG